MAANPESTKQRWCILLCNWDSGWAWESARPLMVGGWLSDREDGNYIRSSWECKCETIRHLHAWSLEGHWWEIEKSDQRVWGHVKTWWLRKYEFLPKYREWTSIKVLNHRVSWSVSRSHFLLMWNSTSPSFLGIIMSAPWPLHRYLLAWHWACWCKKFWTLQRIALECHVRVLVRMRRRISIALRRLALRKCNEWEQEWFIPYKWVFWNREAWQFVAKFNIDWTNPSSTHAVTA